MSADPCADRSEGGSLAPGRGNCAAAAIVEHLGSADTRGTSGT